MPASSSLSPCTLWINTRLLNNSVGDDDYDDGGSNDDGDYGGNDSGNNDGGDDGAD